MTSNLHRKTFRLESEEYGSEVADICLNTSLRPLHGIGHLQLRPFQDSEVIIEVSCSKVQYYGYLKFKEMKGTLHYRRSWFCEL